MSIVRIAFLHLAPCLRDLQANRRLIDRAVTTAATCRCDVDPHAGTLYLWLRLYRRPGHGVDCAPARSRGWPRCANVPPTWG